MPRSSLVFADRPPTLPFHHLVLFMHYSRKIPELHKLINSLSQAFLSGCRRAWEHPNPLFFSFVFFSSGISWQLLIQIPLKKNSVQCFKLIQVILNGPTLPVGRGSGKKAWGNLPFNLEQWSIWPPGWTDSISEVKCHCKLVLLHKNPLSALRWLCYSAAWYWIRN